MNRKLIRLVQKIETDNGCNSAHPAGAQDRRTSSKYLDVTHRYLCQRQDGPASGDDIALAVANGTVILDFSQGDSTTFLASIQTSHRKLNTACTDASQHPEWVVERFVYEVGDWILSSHPCQSVSMVPHCPRQSDV
ncbi:hypothetical protein Hte_011817 [Hypoxylon texense]